MAIIDTKRDVVVVRIVYDGPPLSGKTTSIRALAEILGQQQNIFSPDNTLEKTLYFEWLEYVGGFFKGYGIACQIITVPGQLSLEDRRHFLLQSADAVIFVLDAHVHEHNIALAYFQDLQKILVPQAEDAAIKVVIQANKQDQEQVLSAEQLKDNFKNYKIIESTATLGQGVREAFVVAVRFAVERTEALMAKGKLQMGEPDIVSGEQLLTSLQQSTEKTDEVLKEIAETPEAILSLESEEILVEECVEDSPKPTEVAQMDTTDEEEVIVPPVTLEVKETDDELLKEMAEAILAPESEETPVESPTEDTDTSNQEVSEKLLPQSEEKATTEKQIISEQVTEKIEEEYIFSDEPPASAEELAHEFALSETLARKDLPQRPQKEISAQWLWPPLAGQKLLKAICNPNFKLSFQEEDELWTFQVDKYWYGFSKLEWCYPQVKQAREAFRAQISLHLQCSLLLSAQRGIVVVQEPQQDWRIWQIIYRKNSLADGLAQLLQAQTSKHLAQELFRCAVYYSAALQKSCHCASQLMFSLDHFALEAEQPVYLGVLEPLVVMDEQLSLKTTAGLIDAVKQAFAQHLYDSRAQLKINDIITQLETIEGFEQQMILEGLIQLFYEIDE